MNIIVNVFIDTGNNMEHLLRDIAEVGFGTTYKGMPEESRNAYNRAHALGYLTKDHKGTYRLSRSGQQIVDSGLTCEQWEAQQQQPSGINISNTIHSRDIIHSDLRLSSHDPTHIPKSVQPHPPQKAGLVKISTSEWIIAVSSTVVGGIIVHFILEYIKGN